MKWEPVTYLDGLQAQVSALPVPLLLAGRAAQADTERELSALLPSVLDRAFKGELWPPFQPSPKSKNGI
jgi:hypothetical protein